MKGDPQHTPPADAAARALEPVVICYPVETLPRPDPELYERARAAMQGPVVTCTVPPRDARTFSVKKGQFFRIVSVEGSQVGDLNLFNSDNLAERLYTGKTRALHGTHVSTYDQLWSCHPFLRPLVTITKDTLDWYGFDQDGGSVHDVIGTRCDPYTNRLLSGADYHYCCHSNLIRALVNERSMSVQEAESHVHDVLNVFMCTGFTKDTHQYFMKKSPVRPGDYLEFFAEVNITGVLSACPGGDCGSKHSSDEVSCYPLLVEVYDVSDPATALKGWVPPEPSEYSRTHGI